MTDFDPSATLYTVSRLNQEARYLLEDVFPQIQALGEVSNLSRPSSGHVNRNKPPVGFPAQGGGQRFAIKAQSFVHSDPTDFRQLNPRSLALKRPWPIIQSG